MSLNWDLSAIKVPALAWRVAEKDNPMADEEKGASYMTAGTHALIMVSMALGMNAITEKNWQEFYVRLKMWEAIFGLLVGDSNGKSLLTAAFVKGHIGLKTNASPLSKAAFAKQMYERHEREAMRHLRKELAP